MANNDNTTRDDQFLTNNPDDANPMQDMKQDEQLPEDHDTPFSPPEGSQDRTYDTHQSTDTNIDPHEHYDEGIEGAAEATPPAETKINEYDPFKPGTGAGGTQEPEGEQPRRAA